MNLHQIAEIRTGYAFRDRVRPSVDGDVMVLQMGDLARNESDQIVVLALPGLRTQQCVQAGDVIFRARGKNHLATVAPELFVRSQTVLAAPLMTLRPKAGQVLPAYLEWFINLPSTQRALSDLAGGTYVKTINKAALEMIEVPVPSLAKQKGIVEMSALAVKEHKILTRLADAKAKQMERILMHYAQDFPE